MKHKALVIGIISSAHEGSNSAIMVREALKGAIGRGAETKEIFLPDYHLDYCKGCLICMKNGKCCLMDGFNELREQLYSADGIIWGAPTYAGAPNAIMKNFIDRLGMYEMSTSSLGGKYMAGIASASSSGIAKKVAKSLSRFGIGGTFMRSYSVGYLGAGFKGGRNADNDRELLEKARKLGAKLTNNILTAKSYPLQALPKRILNTLMMRPVFGTYIKNNKDDETKVLYESLYRRNLI